MRLPIKSANHRTDSFALDLKNGCKSWQHLKIGGHAYHATPPTDALMQLYAVMQEAEAIGFDKLKNRSTAIRATNPRLIGRTRLSQRCGTRF